MVLEAGMTMNPGQLLRIAASGTAFLVFGLAGALVSILIVPLLFVIPMGRARRERAGQWLVRKSFALLIGALILMRLMDLDIEGQENYNPGRASVIISNHPIYIDIAILVSRLPQSICIVKNSVWKNPVMGPLARAAGFFPNRNAAYFLEKASKSLDEGKSVAIFPEGTRSFRDRMQPFQRGAVQLALRAGTPVTPCVITCSPPSMYKGSRWYQMAACTCSVRLKILPPIDIVSRLCPDESVQLAARRLTQELEDSYKKWLKPYYEGI